jgi:hypothetical protein
MVYLYGGNNVVMVLDGDVKQTHTANATITEFPLEDGSFANDHTILKPKIFTMSVGVMDEETPFDTYVGLLNIRDNRTLLDIQTHLVLYTDYLIESIDAMEETSTGDVVMFNLTFKEVRFAKSKQVKIERKQLKGDVKDKLQSKANRGTVDHKKVLLEKTPVGDTATSKVLGKNEATIKQNDNSSMLYRIFR